MTVKSTATTEKRNTTGLRQISSYAMKVSFFAWHYLEMMVAMMAGSTLFEVLVPTLPAATRWTLGLRPGTFLYSGGIALAMMVVMVGWMIVRGHGLRHSAEMSVAMLAPVGVVAGISILRGDASLAWFTDTYCAAMCVGMLAAMLYRADHFARWSFRPSHHHAH